MAIDEQYHEILEPHTAIIHEAEIFSFAARATELQVEMIDSLDQYLERLKNVKSNFQADADEYGANLVLALEFLTRAVRAELLMWVLLKNEEPEKAWDSLIDAQNLAAAAIRSHEVGQVALRRMPIYEVLEKVIFPPQAFSSAGFIARYRECSICGASYDACPHVAGMPSMGEYCTVIIKEAELLEVSFVNNPADKRCRVTDFADQGHYRNKMTWRLDLNSHAEARTIKDYVVRWD